MLMKRMVSIALAAFMTWNIMLVPVTAEPEKISTAATAASDTAKDDDLFSKDQMIRIMQSVINKVPIPPEYENFTYSVEKYGDSAACRLRWSATQDTYGMGSVEVTIDKNGSILNYYHYTYSRNYNYMQRLPKVEKAAAFEKAKKFVFLICPEIADQLDLSFYENHCTIDYNGSYRFEFHRLFKNIPYYDNSVFVVINGKTGDIMGFERNWTNGLQFPEPADALGLEQAQKAYRNQVGLILKYRIMNTQGEPASTYLEYSPPSADLFGGIDAISGEKVLQTGKYYNPYLDMYSRGTANSGSGAVLEEDAVKELAWMQKVISPADAEKYVRSISELEIGKDSKMTRYNYVMDGNQQSKCYIQLEFGTPLSKEDLPSDFPDEKLIIMIAAGEMKNRVNITLDAGTLEILEISIYNLFGTYQKETAYSREQMRNTADAFLMKYKKDLYENTVLSEASNLQDPYAEKYGLSGGAGTESFVYTRQAGSILFADNQVVVSVSTATGKITGYRERWDACSFAAPDRVIGMDKAYTALFESNPLTLQYIAIPSSENKGEAKGTELRLVYAPDFRKPVCIDANTGVLIDYTNGQPYKQEEGAPYNDIEGHPAQKAISALADFNLLPATESFRPDDPILQKELLYMIWKIRGDYYASLDSAGKLEQKEQDALYRLLMNEGIILEEERDPDAAVTREQAVSYLLKVVGYKQFAELGDIFNSGYADSKEVHPSLQGYVAIAKALKILDTPGNVFSPKRILTRAEAAVMIYNYLRG